MSKYCNQIQRSCVQSIGIMSIRKQYECGVVALLQNCIACDHIEYCKSLGHTSADMVPMGIDCCHCHSLILFRNEACTTRYLPSK